MEYFLRRDEQVGDGLRRICAEQIDRALDELDDAGLDRHTVVHQVRKRCKKIRGVLRLARGELEVGGAYQTENAWYRDASRSLSDLRDAQALIETCDRLAEGAEKPDRESAESLRAGLVERRRRLADEEEELDRRLARFRARMEEGRERLAGWPLATPGFEVVAPGLKKTYRRARRGLEEAYREVSAEAFHDWRKRVKYHWYHCRLLERIWPPVMTARRDEADRLADLLGREHDLSVLRRAVAEESELAAVPGVERLLRRAVGERESLRAEARPLGRRLLAEPPKRLSRRLAVYWRVWRPEADADAEL